MSAGSKTVEVRIDPLTVSQSYLRDHRSGDWRKDLFHWVAIAKLSWEERELPAIVLAETKVEDRPEATKKRWEQLLMLATAATLDRESLSAFQENDVTYDLPKEAPSSEEQLVSVQISREYAERLAAEYETHDLARRSFQHAVTRVTAHADSPPMQGYASDGPAMLSYIDRCLHAGYLGWNHSWYREKMSLIRHYVADLARRKNRQHAGYKSAQDYIRSNLFSFSPPQAWRERPPTLDPKVIRK